MYTCVGFGEEQPTLPQLSRYVHHSLLAYIQILCSCLELHKFSLVNVFLDAMTIVTFNFMYNRARVIEIDEGHS